MKEKTLNSRGALLLPLGLFSVLLAFIFLGALGILRRERHLIELQLRLDQCVAKTAFHLKKTLDSLDPLNTSIRNIRLAIKLDREPATRIGLEAVLLSFVVAQELILAQWEAKRVLWMTARGCDFKWDSPNPLPKILFERKPPDSVGPQELTWPIGVPKKLHIELGHSPKHAAATVEGGRNGFSNRETEWAPPKGALQRLRAGFF